MTVWSGAATATPGDTTVGRSTLERDALEELERTTGIRECYRCKTLQDLAAFGKGRPRDRLGLSHLCRSCGLSQRAERNALPEWKAKRKSHYEANRSEILDAARLYAYGITRAQYDFIFKKQNGACAVCKRPETAKNRRGEVRMLAVDHDHSCCPDSRKT